jgi:hypothetical protein
VDIIKDEKAKAERIKRNQERAANSWFGKASEEKGKSLCNHMSQLSKRRITLLVTTTPLPLPASPWSEEDIDALPIVIIRNFAIKNAGNREILLTVLADWAAALVDNKVSFLNC